MSANERPPRKRVQKPTGKFATWRVPFDYPKQNGGVEGRVEQLLAKGWILTKEIDGTGADLWKPRDEWDAAMKAKRDDFKERFKPGNGERIERRKVVASDIGTPEKEYDDSVPETIIDG